MPIIPSLLNWRDVAKKYEDTPTPPLQTTPAPDSDEFQQWYADVAKQYNLNPDPNDPRHKYDYRAAYDAGVRAPDETGHWPSVHKAPDHPNRYVDGVDTITGQPVRQAELMSADSPMGRATASADASLWSAEGKPPGQEYVPEPTFWDKMKNQIKDQALDAWEMRRGANQAAAKIWDTGVDVSKNLNPLTMPWNIAHGVDKGLEVPIWGGGPSAGDLLGVDIDSSKMPGMETVQAGQDALSNFFKNIVGTKQALAEPGVTGYSDQAAAEEPIWETAGGTEIVPSRRDLAYMVGEYAPEIGATAYGAGPAMKAYATERLAATNLAPALQERFARAAASSAGAFTGGMAKGEPGEAAMNAVLFPTVELGLEGLGQTAGEILKPPAKLAWKGIKSSLRPLAKMGRKAFNKLFVGTDLVGPQREVARSLLAELNLSDDALRILGENRQAGETFRGVVILLENKTITREVALAKTREIAGVAGVGETLAEVAPGVIPVEGVAGKAIRGEAGEVAARGVADLAAPDEAVAEAALAREAADALAPDEVLAREAAGEMAPDEALAREAAEYAAPEEGIEVAGLETLEKLAEERGSFSTKGKKPKKPKPSEISRTAEDFELNPAKMKDLQEGVVAFQSADGKVHKAKIGEDGVFNHADLMTKRGLDPVKDVPGFIDKKGKFVRQYPKAKKNPLQEAAGIRTMEQAERASGTYVEKGAKHLSKAEQKTGENLFKIEAENIAEARGYKHTWEQLTKEATAALDNMEASFDRDTGKLFIKGKEITDKTIVRDTEMEMIRQIKLGFEQKLAKAAIDLQVNPASAEAKTIFDMALTDAAIISNRFYGVRAEAGRLLNSLKKKVAPGDVYERHLVRFIQEASDDAKQVLMKEILKARHEVELNIAKGMRPEEAYAPMRRVIRDFSNASWQQKLVEWVTMAKLTSPTTHARNFISNSVFMAIQPGVKIASALADLPLAAIRKARGKGGREVFAGEAAAEVFGYATAIKQAFREAYVALKTGVYAGTKGQEVQMYRPAIRGVKGEIVRLPGRFLGAGDAFFKPFARNSVLWSEAYRAAAKKGIRPGSGKFVKFLREFVTNPPKETIEKANSEALRRLFQAPLGKYTKTIAKMRGEHPLSRLVILFLNTPINILKEGHRHLPTGFAMPSVRADLKAGGARASEAIGRMAFGSSAAATIGYLAATGAIDITSAGGTDYQSRFMHKRPYKAIRIGDTWYSYGNMEPFTTIMGFAGAAMDAYRAKDYTTYYEQMSMVANDIYKGTINETYLRGIGDLFDFIENGAHVSAAIARGEEPAGFGKNYPAQLATLPIPTLSGYIARAVDPYQRQNRTVAQNIGRQIPFVSKLIPPKRDAFGQPKGYEGGPTAKTAGGRIAEAFTPQGILKSMFRPTSAKLTPVEKDLKRLWEESGKVIREPSPTYKGIRMDTSEYNEFLRDTGKEIKRQIYALVNEEEPRKIGRRRQSKYWSDMNWHEKRNAVKNIMADVRKDWRGEEDEYGRDFYDRLLAKTLKAQKNKDARKRVLKQLFRKSHLNQEQLDDWTAYVEGGQ